jgi:hypothetical protein
LNKKNKRRQKTNWEMMIHIMYRRFSCKQLICSHRRWGQVVVVVGGVVEGGGGRWREGRSGGGGGE